MSLHAARAPRRGPGARLALALALAVLAGATACDEKYEEVHVALTPTRDDASRPPPGGPAELRFGLAAMLSPRETHADYERVFAALARAVGRKLRLVHGQSYQHTNALLLANKLDMAWVCTGGYAALSHAVPPVELLGLPLVRGQTTYHSLILVGEQSAARAMRDLRGKRFAFVDPLSQTGFRSPVALLREMGTDPDAFFGSYVFAGTHDRAIQAVRRGAADGAAVDELIYRYLQQRRAEAVRGLRAIYRSPPYANPPIVAAPGSSPADRQRWQRALLTLHERSDVQPSIRAIGVERFVRASPDLYRSALGTPD